MVDFIIHFTSSFLTALGFQFYIISQEKPLSLLELQGPLVGRLIFS